MKGLLTYLTYLLLRRSLLILLLLGGMGFAIARWKRHPRVSLMTLIALGFYLVESLAATVFFRYLPDMVGTYFSSTTNTAIYFLEDFAFAAVLILLVAAAFTGRKEKPASQT
jgi:hypothetical protein